MRRLNGDSRLVAQIAESDGICTVSRDGTVVLACPVHFDPQCALDLLRSINSLQTEAGIPIYGACRINGIYVWSLLQEHLFWSYLQPLVKYRRVIDWLAENASEPIETPIQGIAAWHALLNGPAAGGLPPETGGALRHGAETVFLVANALLCGLWGRLRGATMMLWSLNCVWEGRWIDYRLKDIYAALWEQNAAFVEGFPFSGFKSAFRRLRGAKRIVFYAPNILRIKPEARKSAQHGTYDFSRLPALPDRLIAPLIRHFETLAANAKLHTRLLQTLLRLGSFRRVVGIDEHTSYAALLCAARSQRVELVGLQHGVFHKYSIGWCTPGIPHEFTGGYDRIIVWGAYWRSLLAELSSTYTANRLEVGGFIRPSTISLRPRVQNPDPAALRILLPYEFLANPEEIAAYVHAFHARGYTVLFKVRFDDTLEQQLTMLPREKLELVPEITQEVLDSIHVCAGTSTTMMYELLHLGVPAWFISTRHDSNIHMVDKGLAAKITLDMLADNTFNPWDHIIPPPMDGSIFANENMPENVLKLASS